MSKVRQTLQILRADFFSVLAIFNKRINLFVSHAFTIAFHGVAIHQQVAILALTRSVIHKRNQVYLVFCKVVFNFIYAVYRIKLYAQMQTMTNKVIMFFAFANCSNCIEQLLNIFEIADRFVIKHVRTIRRKRMVDGGHPMSNQFAVYFIK